MPASSLVVGRLVLTVTPSVASTGQPVSTTVTVVVDQPLTAADKARADKAAVDQARAVKSMGTPAQNVGPLHVDWGDGTGDTQRAACPSLLASDVPKVVFRHSYRRPGKYPVTVPAATTGCWSTTQTLAATVAVR